MKELIFGTILAFQFLTRIPFPIQSPWNEQTSRWAVRMYPLVGAVIGCLVTAAAHVLAPYVPLPLLTLLILSIWVYLTGGLHIDGWMDVADAIGSNAPLEKKWEIMKDPHVGSFGIISLFFLLGWKILLVYDLLASEQYLFFIVIFAMSRLGAVSFLVFLPSAKKEGLAYAWKQHIRNRDFIIAFVPALLAAIVYPVIFYYILSYFLFFGLYAIWMKRAFAGINGDIVGAGIEGGELWGLLATWIYISFVMG